MIGKPLSQSVKVGIRLTLSPAQWGLYRVVDGSNEQAHAKNTAIAYALNRDVARAINEADTEQQAYRQAEIEMVKYAQYGATDCCGPVLRYLLSRVFG